MTEQKRDNLTLANSVTFLNNRNFDLLLLRYAMQCACYRTLICRLHLLPALGRLNFSFWLSGCVFLSVWDQGQFTIQDKLETKIFVKTPTKNTKVYFVPRVNFSAIKRSYPGEYGVCDGSRTVIQDAMAINLCCSEPHPPGRRDVDGVESAK